MNFNTMLACALSLIFLGVHADDDYYGDLPGDVTVNTSGRGYPTKLMSEDYHGAAFYSSWTVTNGFARFYTVNYNTLSLKGEPKHGLWKWTEAGAGDLAHLWWCEMGGSWDTSVSNGNVDNENQQNMEKMWEVIRESENINVVGPLAEDAKLMNFAVNAIRVYLSPVGRIWLNRGTSNEPAFRAEELTDDEVEYYYVEHLYGYTDIPIFYGIWCDGTNSDNCIHLHSTIVAVIRKEITDGLVGLPIFGTHYGNLTSAGACPDDCGVGPCDCDLVLVDVTFDGPLGTSWHEDEYFIPSWIMGNKELDVCDGLNYRDCVSSCDTCAWVCPSCKECSGSEICAQYTTLSKCTANSECNWGCPVDGKCALVPKGPPEDDICVGRDWASCKEQCATCDFVCPSCKSCVGKLPFVSFCADNIFKEDCEAATECTWLGCPVSQACITV